MELRGTILEKLPVFKGTSARGEWVKQEFILETGESAYPRKVCISVFGDDRVKELENYTPGQSVKVSVNIESREYNGRWYTDVRAWRLEKETTAASTTKDLPSDILPPGPIITQEPDEGADDLPF
ncbi:MAG: DUF3127 domain-containing protein [Bacteroidales bacterium]|jgi:hypothetical protein|nr:DUF3127 domain-containing protein [Bacteroidales bacterium]